MAKTGENARLLHFRKSDQGYLLEYIVLLEQGDDTPADDHCIPGYELVTETEIETVDCSEMPSSLPFSETMMKRH